MKRFYKVLLPALLLALALGGCKSRDAATTTDGSAYSESSRTVLTTQAESLHEDTAETSTPGASTEKADVTGKPAATTTKPGTATTKPGAATTKPGETTAKPAASTAKPGAATTKPGETTAKPGAASTKPGTTTTKPATTTKPTSTTTTTTTTTAKPGAPAVNPTTKPAETTAAPVAKGDRIAGRITYLNEANDYAAKLTAEKLKYFGMPADKQKDVLAHPEKYAFYSLDIAMENKESVPVTLYYLDAGGNGTGGIYINGDTSGDIGLPVGGSITNRFFVIAPAEDADGSVLSKVRGMNLRIKYAATLEDDSAPVQYVYSKIG